MKFISKSETETVELGAKIGGRLFGGEVIALIGDLGGGKTQFTKGLGRALGVKEPIISPTFTIERIYGGNKLTLHHFDFYRLLNDDQEIEEGIYDLLDDSVNVVVIEWAYNLEQVLPDNFLEVKFEYTGENERKIEIITHGNHYEKLIEDLQ
jgi:tRNA threonylcarbamoyladenosine biosynthesis protein TsaE